MPPNRIVTSRTAKSGADASDPIVLLASTGRMVGLVQVWVVYREVRGLLSIIKTISPV
jgi:hypothetical protein